MSLSAEITTQTTVVEIHRTRTPAWESRVRSFLVEQELPTLSHDPAWIDIFRHGLSHPCYYLEARQGDKTVGVLPLTLVKSFLFGRFLVSLPYLNQGGPMTAQPEVAEHLISTSADLAEELKVKYLELRNLADFAHPALTVKKTSKVLMWLDLPTDPDALWKSFKPEVRNQIRKAEKEQLVISWGGLDKLDAFYEVFSKNMRDLGTPVFGKSLFGSMLKYLPGQAELCLVEKSGQPIAGAILTHGNGYTEVPSASSLREFNKTCANMLMYHQLILRAIERGQRIFDFGRSSEDSGTYKFKKQWGAKPRPSIWQYKVLTGEVGEVRPDSPKYQRRIETWKKLPLWLTRLAGPHIVRGIP